MNIPDLAPGEAVMVDWTAEEYHADTQCESRSELWMLSQDAPLYHAIVVEESMPWPASKDMDIGTLIHLAVLEPARFYETVRIKIAPPRSTRPTGAHADAAKMGLVDASPWSRYDEHLADLARFEAGGGTVLTVKQCRDITDIAERVRTHGFASDLLALPGTNEQTVIWREPTSGLLCRVRWDLLRYLPEDQPGGTVVIGDLKSSRSPKPDEFGRSIANLGYDFQGAFYSDAARAVFPGREVIYAIIAAGKDRPYKVAAGPLADRAIDSGRRKYRAALADLVRRRETNNWRDTWEEDRGLVFDMPGWAYPKEDR